MTLVVRRRVAFPLLLLLQFLSASCAINPTSDRAGLDAPEAKLLAQMRASCGGDAWDRIHGWHEAGRVTMGGRPGLTYEAFHEITTLRTTYVQRLDGKIVRLGGFDGTNTWRVRPDGTVETGADATKLRKARRDMYLSNAGYFFPKRFPAHFELMGVQTLGNRKFDVLRLTPTDAESADLWVDRKTHRVFRVVAGSEMAEGSDYRMFGAVCGPTRLRQSDGDPAHDIVLYVESIETGPIDPTRFIPSANAVSP